ncbi:MAG: hypothetical protein H6Q04_3090 [Acidobacteria bacterium]|jgi:hypothetical protein|nr:hypothetical protein [Acidobacteriota bacterium]
MRVENTYVPQPLVDSPKVIEKKDIDSVSSTAGFPEEPAPFIPLPFGSGRTYSLSSLRAAVDYHAKFLTVAESNLEAADHPARIPKAIIDGLANRIS